MSGLVEARWCPHCGEIRPSDQFATGQKLCRPHTAAYQRAYRAANRDRLRAAKLAGANKAREIGLQVYGARCVCCGETEPKFLTIDHIDGRSDDDKYTSKKAWLRLKRLGWPKTVQILCFNCNCAKGVWGVCPHQEPSRIKEQAAAV